LLWVNLFFCSKVGILNNQKASFGSEEKVVAIIQARMSSKRFPKKILHHVQGKPLLSYMVERLERCEELDEIIISTSKEKSDDPVEFFCRENKIKYFRGPLENVALRFKETLETFSIESFVRLSGDSPLLDPAIVSKAIQIFREKKCSMVTNVLNRTYPKGQSVELLNSKVFLDTFKDLSSTYDQEHVTPFFYNNKNRFQIESFSLRDEDYSVINLSVDTKEDMNRFKSIINIMRLPHTEYGLEEILSLYQNLEFE
jgi:spore coat polysaccharide biosynthesis protein SpsF